MPTHPRTRARSTAAIWYRLRADLSARHIQSISVTLVVALSAFLVSLGLVTLTSVAAPYDDLFTELHGAHLWVRLSSHPTHRELDAITTAPNVASATELEEYVTGSVVLGTTKVSAYLESHPTQQPAIDRILILKGNNLTESAPDGVVIDQSFAEGYHLGIGDMLPLVTAQGLQRLYVRGISIDVRHGSDDGGYRCRMSGGYRCRIYVLRSTLERLFPAPDQLNGIMGLRLANPTAIHSTITTLMLRLQAQGATYAFWGGDDWLSFRAAFGEYSSLAATLLLTFGILGIIAAGFIVANLVIGQVLAQQRELGMLKALGFTPLQLTSTLLCEYLLLGTLGGILGMALAVLAAPWMLDRISASLGIPVPLQYHLGMSVLLLAAILLLIAISIILPAWRAAHLRTVDSIRPHGATPRQGHTWPSRLLVEGRIPLVVGVGLRGITARPLRALLILLTLLTGIITAVFGLGLSATIHRYVSDPRLQGVYADVHVSPDLYDPILTQRLITGRTETASYYTTYQTIAHRADSMRPLNILFAAGDTHRISQAVSAGRWYHEHSAELVMAASMLQNMDAHLGDQVLLAFSFPQGHSVQETYTIVGVLPVIGASNPVYAPLSALTDLAAVPSTTILTQTTYEITLRSGISRQSFMQTLLQLTDDRISVHTWEVVVPDTITQLNDVMTVLSVALMLIAGVSVLNALLLTTRERIREFGTLKAIGFTPRQITMSVTSTAVTLAVVAIAGGIPLGLWITRIGLTALGKSRGLTGIALGVNWQGLALLMPVTVVIAVLGACLPARWAARVSPGEVLRYE